VRSTCQDVTVLQGQTKKERRAVASYCSCWWQLQHDINHERVALIFEGEVVFELVGNQLLEQRAAQVVALGLKTNE
jgi:hypothetical protein